VIFAGFAAVVVVAIAELVLAATWNPFYCTVGLPIFARRVERAQGLAGVQLDELERRSATAAAQGFKFRQLGPDKIAFHEQGFGIVHYTPIMRGLIRHDPAEPGVVVLGLVNWFVVALVVVLVAGLRRNIIDLAPYLGGAFAILYFVQAMRFWRVGNQLASRR